MARTGVQGLAETYAEFGRVPNAAHEEMAVELAVIAREISAAQHADVPKATGELDAALSYQVLLDRLKARMGLLRGGRAASKFNGRTRAAKAGGPFYGRIVEGGRRGQTVLVTRRVKKRRVRGNGRVGSDGRKSVRQVQYLGASARVRRRGPNKGTPIGSPYRLRVKAKAGRPFVAQPLFQQVAEQHLAEFWAGVFARSGANA